MTTSSNPLHSRDVRIPFHRIRAEHVVPGIRETLKRAEAAVEEVASRPEAPDYRNVVEALDGVVEEVRRTVTPVGHLLGVAETPELREAYNEVLPELSRFWTRLWLHEGLWSRLRAVAESEEGRALTGIRARHLEKLVRDFRRAGADLDPGGKRRLEELHVELSRLEQHFSENVLDATKAYTLHVTDEDRLAGIPERAVEGYRRKARDRGLEGWLLTLDQPSYEPVLKYARDRELRRELYVANAGRCREGEHENRSAITAILGLRGEIARLLGYRDFPDYQLEEKMAGTGERARGFVQELADLTRPYWERDLADLRGHAPELGLDELRPWDVAFVIEDLRRERYDLDDERIRPYFPLDAVLDGLFEVARRVFGVEVREREIEEVWHPDVRYYDVFDEEGRPVGHFYTDWFPREEKRQGAWMNDFISGVPVAGDDPGGLSPHVGTICGNFPEPSTDAPSLLNHREVQTTFHEFGHLLHHLSSRVPIPARGGLHVAWDFVELPSQIMENWTWEKEALDTFARHWETGEPLPEDLYRRMLAARRFMGGWAQMRQLSFAHTDLRLHTDYDPETDGDVLAHVEALLGPFVPGPEFARHHNLTSFTHLFAGGYASLYYSYLWSEVLDADAFSRFHREGIFDREVGRAFVDAILSRGDSADPDVLFREFMGRDPDPSALVTRNLGDLRAEPAAAS